ncbi:unnamed protein product (macronuclear) [Paramecium tetraurelia]|uniref:Transmembrane protein n=1 Tax=Paramecium tetraurelia TaxID=5888 RepID=A0E7P8_PARTE|nr:uncharacterized protein GSPATT00024043001 [Paramecium tetraurelia]CAK91315.1 unnamed protein product [Paramecium tetraurelia]|eukprot:XP_001458712.1 hypothetical protein (macronuclear) [Paramecium tetraurelia strain d4-2]
MDSTIAMNQSNYPGPHIQEDLQQIEHYYQQPGKNQINKCSLFFLIFQNIVIFTSFLSVMIGNSKQLGCPFDSNGNICGGSPGLEQYKYIYFSNPSTDKSLYLTVCVKECPVKEIENEIDELLEIQCMPNQFIKSCKNTLFIGDNDFSLIYYDSLKFINVCLPTKSNYLQNVLVGLESPEVIKFFKDLENGALIIFCTFVFSILINQIVYVLLIKLQQKTIWIIQVTLILMLFLQAFLCINNYLFVIKLQQANKNSKLTLPEVVSIVQNENSNFTISFLPLILGIFFVILAIYYISDLIYNYKQYQTIGIKIKIVNYFYDYSSQALQDSQNKSKSNFQHFYLIPIVFGITNAGLFFVWVLIANFILTIGNVTTHRYPFNTFQLNLLAYAFGIIHILGLLLLLLVISGISKFLIIGIMLKQYGVFVNEKSNSHLLNEQKSTMQILKTLIFKNIDAIILGQVLISLLWIPRALIKIYLWMLSNPNYLESNLIQNILSINERAYLLSFIRTEGFLQNAKCQYLFDQKLMKHTQIQQHGQLFMNSCSLTISILCMSFTYLLLIYTRTTIIIQAPIYFLVFSFFSSYFVTKFFSHIYGISIDYLTILLYRDVTVDGQVVGKSVRKPIRLLKETLINIYE